MLALRCKSHRLAHPTPFKKVSVLWHCLVLDLLGLLWRLEGCLYWCFYSIVDLVDHIFTVLEKQSSPFYFDNLEIARNEEYIREAEDIFCRRTAQNENRCSLHLSERTFFGSMWINQQLVVARFLLPCTGWMYVISWDGFVTWIYGVNQRFFRPLPRSFRGRLHDSIVKLHIVPMTEEIQKRDGITTDWIVSVFSLFV